MSFQKNSKDFGNNDTKERDAVIVFTPMAAGF